MPPDSRTIHEAISSSYCWKRSPARRRTAARALWGSAAHSRWVSLARLDAFATSSTRFLSSIRGELRNFQSRPQWPPALVVWFRSNSSFCGILPWSMRRIWSALLSARRQFLNLGWKGHELWKGHEFTNTSCGKGTSSRTRVVERARVHEHELWKGHEFTNTSCGKGTSSRTRVVERARVHEHELWKGHEFTNTSCGKGTSSRTRVVGRARVHEHELREGHEFTDTLWEGHEFTDTSCRKGTSSRTRVVGRVRVHEHELWEGHEFTNTSCGKGTSSLVPLPPPVMRL